MWDFTSERSNAKFQVSWDYGVETRSRHAKHIFYRSPSVTPKGHFGVFCGKKSFHPSGQTVDEIARKPTSKKSPCPRVRVLRVNRPEAETCRIFCVRVGGERGGGQSVATSCDPPVFGRHAPRVARVLRASGPHCRFRSQGITILPSSDVRCLGNMYQGNMGSSLLFDKKRYPEQNRSSQIFSHGVTKIWRLSRRNAKFAEFYCF